MDWHTISAKKTLDEMETELEGLTSKKAKKRLEEHGYNEIKKTKKESPLVLLLNQFKNPLVYILLIGAAVSYFFEYATDALLIFAIVILNAVLGFGQEWRAERAIETLAKMFILKARVKRDGKEIIIHARDVVPGDIVVLEAGDEVPADARLIETANLKVNEAPLTGESVPVQKNTEKLSKDTMLADRINMIYAGTLVVNGWAEAVVVSTGMKTELGRIAELTTRVERGKTPTEKLLETLAQSLLVIFIFFSILTVIIGIAFGKETIEMILVGISMAVAAVPEGLPAVITIVFAVGLQRLSKVNTLVRKLSATETLGSVTYICADKTGTLTENKMSVEKIFINNTVIKPGEDRPGLDELIKTSVLCNHASLTDHEATGDPTEAALLVYGKKKGFDKGELDKEHRILNEISFTLERKMMTVITKDHSVTVNTKGAPESILDKCSHYLYKGKKKKLSKKQKEKILEKNGDLAEQGYRVLAIAKKEMEKADVENAEKNLVYVGSVCLSDPVRPEARDAIRTAKDAGIKIAIVTGDHKKTAIAVAKQVGLFTKKSVAIDGKELEKMSDHELNEKIENIRVFARVTPEQKMRILGALQKKGEIVAMTGDGVNDAPALKKADIGIAMGKIGTDVARETADVVLVDDNFASIIKGISEGRGIFLNIKRFVHYMLSSNIAEIGIIFTGVVMNLPLILLPVQILWVNLATDSVTAISLGLEPKPKDIMKRKPERRRSVLQKKDMPFILLISATKLLLIMILFFISIAEGEAYARTMAFAALIIAENINLFNFKSFSKPLYKINVFENKYLLFAFIGTIVLSMLVIQTGISQYFHLTPLSPGDWAVAALFAVPVLVVGEIYKHLKK